MCVDAVVPITCFIIACLFALQHYGTHRVGFLFAPVVLVWLFCISTLGVYNIIHWNPQVYRALSPYYMYIFLKKTKKSGWMSLGGILLCITGNQNYQIQTCRFLFTFSFFLLLTNGENYAGSEAMFADLGHFSYTAIQVDFKTSIKRLSFE